MTSVSLILECRGSSALDGILFVSFHRSSGTAPLILRSLRVLSFFSFMEMPTMALSKICEGFAVFRNGVVANEYATKIWAYPPGRPCQQVHMPDAHGFICHGIKSACCAKHPRPSGTFPIGTTMALLSFVLLCVRSSLRLPTDFSDHGLDPSSAAHVGLDLTHAIFTHVVPLHHFGGLFLSPIRPNALGSCCWRVHAAVNST